MTSAADRLAHELADLKRQVAALSRTSQLSRSSVDIDGADVRVVDGIRSGIEAGATATVALDAANGKNKVTYSPTDPDVDGTAVGDVWFKRNPSTGVITGSWEWDGTDWDPVVFDDAVLASLTVGKIVTGEIAAGERIIAGPENSNHAELTDSGIHVYTVDPDGQVVEAGRFGTNGNDRLLITDGAGRSLASIDATGGASFSRVDVESEITLGGNPLAYIFDQSPRGLLARAGVTSSSTLTSTNRGAYDVEFIAEPGRAYRISTSPINLNPSTTVTYCTAWLQARPSSEGPPSLAAGKAIVSARGSANIAGGVVPVTLSVDVSFSELFTGTPPTVPTAVRVLLCYGVVSGGGSVGIYSTGTHPTHTYVADMGLERPFTGVINDGSGATAAPIVQYTTEWAATWAANWNGLNSAPRTGYSEIVQGYTDAQPAVGSGIGQSGFGNGVRNDGSSVGTFSAELAGATIQSARIFVYSTHWHWDFGGIVILGSHSNPSPVGTKPTDWALNRLLSNSHPKPGGKWIDLPPSWYAGLKDGTIRGFTFGDGLSTDAEFYGRIAADPSDVRRPVVSVQYTK